MKTTVSVVERNLSFAMDIDFKESYNNPDSQVYKDTYDSVSADVSSVCVIQFCHNFDEFM